MPIAEETSQGQIAETGAPAPVHKPRKKSKAPRHAQKAERPVAAAPQSDILLKTIFVVLGIALLVAAFYVGYEIGRGAAKTAVAPGTGSS